MFGDNKNLSWENIAEYGRYLNGFYHGGKEAIY